MSDTQSFEDELRKAMNLVHVIPEYQGGGLDYYDAKKRILAAHEKAIGEAFHKGVLAEKDAMEITGKHYDGEADTLSGKEQPIVIDANMAANLTPSEQKKLQDNLARKNGWKPSPTRVDKYSNGNGLQATRTFYEDGTVEVKQQTEQYRCQSYFDDGVLQDCTCGKCEVK